MTMIRLSHLDTGKPYCEAKFGDATTHAWSWICDTLCRDHACTEDDIGTVEDPERGDLVTVRGAPVASISRHVL